MAHYDCSDCGSSMGVHYGSCTSCTPKEVIDLQLRLSHAVKQAEKEFDDEFCELKDKFVKEQTRELREKYLEAYQRGKNKINR